MLEQMEEMTAGMTGFTQKIAGKQRETFATLFAGLYDLSDEEAKAKKVGNGTTLYYFKEMGQPTVAQWLERTSKPMLVMQGEQDFQVKHNISTNSASICSLVGK